MHRWLALLGVVMVLSASADGLVHDHGLGGAHPSCMACQARGGEDVAPPALDVAVPAPPVTVALVEPVAPRLPQRPRYRLAPKTSPPVAPR